MVENTNLHALQNEVKFAPTKVEEMKTFVGIHILMGNLHYPRISFYWDSQLEIPQISRAMPINRFHSLRPNLHFINTMNKDEDIKDSFWKVRPIYDIIRARCLSLPLETHLSIDEQMIPFKGKLNMKQYVQKKPKPLRCVVQLKQCLIFYCMRVPQQNLIQPNWKFSDLEHLLY
ncbi:hypothetical protein JTB14_024239 [Gonioctena quinquepunctata]|nr:hypothetical protein JTB14_024239 [Gonioctena quinquepunctata]